MFLELFKFLFFMVLIVADSHGVFFSKVFGSLEKSEDAWERNDALAPIKIMEKNVHSGDFYVLNPKNKFFALYQNGGVVHLSVNPAIAQEITSVQKPYSACFLSLDGNVHMANFMCESASPFDFYYPSVGFLHDSQRQIIPREAVSDFFDKGRALLEAKLQSIRNLIPNTPCFFVSPPPPIPSDEHIKKRPEIFNFEANRLAPPLLRMKIYRVYCDFLQTVCGRVGLRFIPQHAVGVDSEGFLKPEFWEGCTHAATGYYQALNSFK